jgi:hypothetical protein
MLSYILTVVGYPASNGNGTFEWSITRARGRQLAVGRGTISRSGNSPQRSTGLLTMRCSPASSFF